MNSTTFTRSNKVAEPGLNQPAISIILPFEPKMATKSDMTEQLKHALDKVQQEVITNAKDDISILVMQKLRNIIRNLNYSTYKKSIAIYVSPVFEKVLYLDIPVEPKISVNEPFNIRDLIVAKRQTAQYLALVLSDYSSDIYFGCDLKITKVKANMPYIPIGQKEVFHKQQAIVANLPDPAEERMNRIVFISDEGVSALLPGYPLPVFAIGPRKVLNHFQANSTNKNRIIQYVYTSTDAVSQMELTDLIKPHVNDWHNVKMKFLRQQLDVAMHIGKLAIGIGNVWKMAAEGKGRLLLIEDNYRYAAQLLESEDGLYTAKEPYHKYSHIRDAVDDIIEIVLEKGGDVEFVEKGLLDDVKNIALVS